MADVLDAAEAVQRLSQVSPELATGGGWSDAAPLIRSAPDWAAEVGALEVVDSAAIHAAGAGSGRRWLVWCAPGEGAAERSFPSELVLDLPPGRYAVATWDAQQKRIVGAESAVGGPLVCGPPFTGGPLAVEVRLVNEGKTRPSLGEYPRQANRERSDGP